MRRGTLCLLAVLVVSAAGSGWAQVNSGSDGSDGAFNPVTNVVVNMADHPTGIYQYTSVTVPSGVTVTFVPNAANTPVVWLVQGNATIDGTVDVSGAMGHGAQQHPDALGGQGGPGGWRGGNGAPSLTSGQGPGGGIAGGGSGGNASYATPGNTNRYGLAPGPVYGDQYLIPLLGGSGGGGGTDY